MINVKTKQNIATNNWNTWILSGGFDVAENSYNHILCSVVSI